MQSVKSSSVDENKDEKPITSLRASRSSQGLLNTPKPYRQGEGRAGTERGSIPGLRSSASPRAGLFWIINILWYFCRTAAQPQPQQSVSILSKTQNYLHEKRKRSQSQPPVADKKEKRKFDFLSTANFNPIQRESKKIDMQKSNELQSIGYFDLAFAA